MPNPYESAMMAFTAAVEASTEVSAVELSTIAFIAALRPATAAIAVADPAIAAAAAGSANIAAAPLGDAIVA
jgi:hypothetical protein